MRYDERLAVLPIEVQRGGMVASLAALSGDGSVALFDAGLPGSLPAIRAALDAAGLPLDRVDRVFVTHHDFDHIGGLPELADAAGGRLRVFAHEEERPFVEGALPSYKSRPDVRARMALRQPAGRPLGPAHAAPALRGTKVDGILADGDVVDVAGGVEAVHLPGHTPGHLGYYLRASRVLVAGDALRIADGILVGPAPEHSADIDQAYASLAKLTRFDIAAVACYHGGLFADGANERIRAIAAAGPGF